MWTIRLRHPGVKFASTTRDDSLNEALASNDLGRICRAVDDAILQSGRIVEIARAAKINRTTLYRAFRLQGGPGLDTMIRVLRALGFQLIVELQQALPISDLNHQSVKRRTLPERDRQAIAIARRFTTALRTGNTSTLLKVFAEALRAQENVAALAKRTTTSREHLYRVFSRNLNPRFSTLLSYVNALGLRFAVRRLSSR